MPAVWETGLNGGVMYLRLDLLRKSDFVPRLLELGKEWRDRAYFAEQDLLNILFSNQTHSRNQQHLFINFLSVFAFFFQTHLK